ncbi:MAG TPA: hypothetical protein VFV95_13930 [Vicinamibacterales bacterium]|nr:hypothetical protein [Vicinamibacterales bacterium]
MRDASATAIAPIDRVIGQIKAGLEKQAPTHVQRDAHPKMHGCVQAELVVRAVDPQYAHGLFAKPGTHRAWVRFSNAFENHHDLKNEPRGLAIKVLDVQGERVAPVDEENSTQDFILVTYGAFFLRDPNDYLEFLPAVKEGSLSVAWFFLKRFSRWRGGWALFRSGAVLARSPLALEYFSQTPYKLGSGTVKLKAVPRLTPELKRSLPGPIGFVLKRQAAGFVLMLPKLKLAKLLAQIGGWDPTPASAADFCDRRIAAHDLLRHALMSFLAGHDAWFDLQVQRYTDKKRTPADDDTKLWKGSFETVATLRIPRQVFWPESGVPHSVNEAAKQLTELGENMSFNPWHALKAHEPAGEINKARRLIYPAIMRFRRSRNGVAAATVLARQSAPSYEQLRAYVQGGTVPAVAPGRVPPSVSDYVRGNSNP